MKTLKFKEEPVIEAIIKGKINRTWRLFDDKHLEIDDTLQLVNSDTGKRLGYAKIDKIIVKRLEDIDDEDMKDYKTYKNTAEIIKEFSEYYGDKVSKDSIMKIIYFTFLGKKLALKDVKPTTQITEVKVYTDGGSRGNPGPSACGYVVTDLSDDIIEDGGKYLGITTNNQAEYQSALMALQAVQKLGSKKVKVLMDSLLVVNQINGEYKVKNRDLLPLYELVKKMINEFESVEFVHIPRAINQSADGKVNEILDQQALAK